MTALVGSYDPKRKDGQLIRYPLAAGVHVFKGALVCVVVASGLLVPGADVAGVVCVGVAYEEGNNGAGGVQYDGSVSSGAAGAVSVRVETVGLYQYHKTGAVQADVASRRSWWMTTPSQRRRRRTTSSAGSSAGWWTAGRSPFSLMGGLVRPGAFPRP